MRRLLVTGAMGFIGSACLPRLSECSFEIHATTRHPYRDEHATWHQVDVLDRSATRALLEEVQPTHLLHLAWGASEGGHWNSPTNFSWLVASVALIEEFAARGGERLVATGTCAEYAPSTTACKEEVTPLKPPSIYGACKAALSTLIPGYAATLGLPSWSWARLFHPYGPGDRAGRFIPTLIRTLHRRERMTCTTGQQRRDFMYIDDTADALVRLVDSDVQGPVNIASGEPIAVRSFVSEIGRQLDALDLIDFGARPASGLEAADLLADVTRQNGELGFRPSTSVPDGVERTLAWYLARGRFDD